jgi:hypothetical protein
MKIQAYVFVDTTNPGPKRVVKLLREISGVVRADALLGTPDIVALVEGDDVAAMQSSTGSSRSMASSTPSRKLSAGCRSTC